MVDETATRPASSIQPPAPKTVGAIFSKAKTAVSEFRAAVAARRAKRPAGGRLLAGTHADDKDWHSKVLLGDRDGVNRS